MNFKRKFAFVGIVLPAFLACVVALLLRARAPGFDDSDLKLVQSNIADEENAFLYLAQAATNLYWPKGQEKEIGRIAEEENWDTTFESELLSKNQALLALLGKAVNCPGFEVPSLKGSAEEYPYLTDWRHVSRLASIQAARLLRQGKPNEAFELAMRIIRLGHMMEDSHGQVLHYLVGSAVKAEGLKQLRQMTKTAALPSEQLISYVQRLNAYRANQTGLTNAFKAEYGVSVKWIEDMRSGRSLGTNSISSQLAISAGMKPVLSLSKTKALLARSTRICLKSIPQSFNKMSLQELSPPSTNPSVLRMILKGNAVGEILIGMTLPMWERSLSRKCQENVTVSATQLILALKAYHSDHGTLPESLAQLTPHYIASVPVDDFDGKLLRYSKEKKLVWSVEKDLVDSGGQSDQNKQKQDLPFRIEF